MQFRIRGEPVDVKVTTLVLEAISSPDLIMFHCHICGSPAFKYNGNIVSIISGGSDAHIPILVKCPNCNHIYLLNSVV